MSKADHNCISNLGRPDAQVTASIVIPRIDRAIILSGLSNLAFNIIIVLAVVMWGLT